MSSVIPVGIVIIMVVIVIVLVVGILVVKKTLPRRKQSTGSADSESEVGTVREAHTQMHMPYNDKIFTLTEKQITRGIY